MKKIILLLNLLVGSVGLFAQVEVGQWEAHLTYDVTNQVVATPHVVYALANNHLYAVDTQQGQSKTLTKIDGLSGNSVQIIGYNKATKILLIVYSNANIDLLLEDGTIYQIPDLKDKNWSVDKTVYQIYFEEDIAYLACGFGVVAINLTQKEIKDTYIIGLNAQKIPVYGFGADKTHYYALSDSVIYSASKTNANLLDFQVWQNNPIKLPLDVDFCELYVSNESIYILQNKSNIWQYTDKQWNLFLAGETNKVSWTQTEGENIITSGTMGVYVYSQEMNLLHQYNHYALSATKQNNQIVIACGTSVCYLNKDGNWVYTVPSSMPNVPVKEITIAHNQLYVSPGGYWLDRYRNSCVIPILNNQTWTRHTASTMQASLWTDVVYDVTSIAVDPNNANHFYFSTWGEGVFEVLDGKIINHYNETNTHGVLQSAIPDNEHYVRVDGLKLDDKGNLWILNYNSGIKILTPEGKWHQLNYAPLKSLPAMRHLHFSSKLKWFVDVRSTPGLFVFNDNGTLSDTTDDKYRFFGAGDFVDKDGKVLSPTYVYDIDEATDGTIWVATDLGPILFTGTSKVFNSNYRCTRIKIPRNDGTGLADYLLDGVTIMSVAIDAGNRKWLGTQGAGVYLLSPDGKTTIHHFTTENSPLSDNNVQHIEIDHVTGKVYFATSDGLFSYRSDAMQSEDVATTQTVYAFPNPVRPDFGGVVTIAGLEQDSKVWITDASANVVFEGKSHGGSLSWDTRNASGQMVSGGVYFVLVSNANSEAHRSVATKILVVR